jgi:tetratricopeptide (TPR) repeat protein
VSDQVDPDGIRAENIHASAERGGTAVGAVQARDIGELHIGDKVTPETLTLRATPPAPPPHFTGREDDLTKLTQLLTSGQNVAITALQGMGGIGKTALAQKLAEQVRDQFPGGVLWWTLGPSADVFTALDVWARHADPRADLTALPRAEDRAEAVRPLLARLGKLCAIVDDVWDEAAARSLMSAIPPGGPILITTRDGDLAKSLRCRVERIDALSDDEAVALLEKLLGPLDQSGSGSQARRADLRSAQHVPTMQSKEARPSTTPLRGSAQDAYSAAYDIARLTEGLPLALELIAGIADSPADLPDLAQKLRTKPTLGVLKRGTTREHSIEACFTMSYERLDADMQRRFRALGVFAPAPFDRDAIAAVWDEDGDAVDEAIKFLTRRSLLTRVIQSQRDAAQSRSEAARNLVASGDTLDEYHQHALLREYALKLLGEPSPGAACTPSPFEGEGWGEGGFASRHAAYYRRLAEEKDWRTVEHFFDQIDYGWQWVQADAPDQIIGYVFAIRDFLFLRGRRTELLDLFDKALAQARLVNDRLNEGVFLNEIGRIRSNTGRPQEALKCYEQAVTIYRELNNRKEEGTTLNNIAGVHHTLGQRDTALDFYQQALAIHREVGSRSMEGTTLNNIGGVHDALGQMDTALDFYQQALAIHREVGDRSGEGTTLNNIGLVYNALGQMDTALDFFQQALAIRREVGDRSGEGATLNNIAAVYDALGQRDTALDFFQQALAISCEVGDRSGEGTTLNNIAAVYDALGQRDTALDFYQQALAILREVGDRYGEGVTLGNMGDLFERMNRLEEAEEVLQQAVAALRDCRSPQADQAQVWLDRVRGKLGKA